MLSIKWSLTRDFGFKFIHESVSPSPLSIQFRLFQFFSKICGDIQEWIFFTGVNDTGNKLFTGVDKFITSEQWSPVSLTLAIKLSLATMMPAINNCSLVSTSPEVNFGCKATRSMSSKRTPRRWGAAKDSRKLKGTDISGRQSQTRLPIVLVSLEPPWKGTSINTPHTLISGPWRSQN